MKILKNDTSYLKHEIQNNEIGSILIPHNKIIEQKYYTNNSGIDGFDLLYYIYKEKLYFAFPKKMSVPLQGLVIGKAYDCAEQNYQCTNTSIAGIPVVVVSSKEKIFGASVIQVEAVRKRISELLYDKNYYMLFLNNSQIYCIPERTYTNNPLITKKEMREMVQDTISKMDKPLSNFIYFYNKEEDKIDIVK